MTSPIKRDLHPALVHLLLAGFCAIGFLVLAANISSRQPITNFDARQANLVHQFAVEHPDVWNFAEWITDLGAGRPRMIVIIGVVLFLLAERRCRMALLWGATQWLLQYIVGYTKDCYERPRPHFEINSYPAGGWSFPSGHAAGAMVTYGMLAFLVAWRWPGKWYTWIAVGLLGAIVLMVGVSRMLLGVHWFTDILGGYLLGLIWISLCVAIVEWQRCKNSPMASGVA